LHYEQAKQQIDQLSHERGERTGALHIASASLLLEHWGILDLDPVAGAAGGALPADAKKKPRHAGGPTGAKVWVTPTEPRSSLRPSDEIITQARRAWQAKRKSPGVFCMAPGLVT
jgi:hypothetical protein